MPGYAYEQVKHLSKGDVTMITLALIQDYLIIPGTVAHDIPSKQHPPFQKKFRIPAGSDLTAVFLGAVVCVFGDLLTARAIRLAGSTTIAFVALTEPVVAILTDYMYYGTVPSFLQCIGYGMMLVSIIVISIGRLQK